MGYKRALAGPNFRLDVAGNINLDTFNFYRIGSMEALYIDTARNVGVGMFNEMNTITTGNRNIAVGYLSGSSLTTGFQNAFLGSYAGEDAASGSCVALWLIHKQRLQFCGILRVHFSG